VKSAVGAQITTHLLNLGAPVMPAAWAMLSINEGDAQDDRVLPTSRAWSHPVSDVGGPIAQR